MSWKFHLIAVTVILAGATGLQAASDWAWTGATDGDWTDASNWLLVLGDGAGGPPPPNNDAVEFHDVVNSVTVTNRTIDLNAAIYTGSSGSGGGSLGFLCDTSGYSWTNGEIRLAGGGSGATLSFTNTSGSNTFDVIYGTHGGGNSLAFNQAAGGTLIFGPNANGIGDAVTLKGTTLTGAGDFIIQGILTANVSGRNITFSTTGTVTVQASGQITGGGSGRFVRRGKVIVDGTANNQGVWNVTGSTAGDNPILGGSGTLNSAVTVGGTNPGTMAPGSSAGMLTVAADVSFLANGKLAIEIGNPGQNDKLAITAGNLAITAGAVLDVSVLPATVPGGSYEIITYTGTRTGSFFTLGTVPPGTQLTYDDAGKRVLLAIPEPASLLLLGVGALLLAGRPTRKD